MALDLRWLSDCCIIEMKLSSRCWAFCSMPAAYPFKDDSKFASTMRNFEPRVCGVFTEQFSMKGSFLSRPASTGICRGFDRTGSRAAALT